MTKRSEAKYKIDRRMGENIWGRPKSPVNKREYGPGQHGQRRKGKMSDFGTQLKAKQKLKGYYANLSERQFHKVYDEAVRMTGDSSVDADDIDGEVDAFEPADQFEGYGGVEELTARLERAGFAVEA